MKSSIPASMTPEQAIDDREARKIVLMLSAAHLRRDIWEGHHRCFDSFLHALACQLAADEAGVIRVTAQFGNLEVIRYQSPFSGRTRRRKNAGFHKFSKEVARRLHSEPTSEPARPGKFGGFVALFRLSDLAPKIRSDADGWLTLRRFWPDPRWRERGGEDDRYWTYVIKPMLFMSTANEGNVVDVLTEIGHLSAAFVRWKLETYEQQRDLFREDKTRSQRIFGWLRNNLVRPVKAEALHGLLNSYQHHGKNVAEWISYIQEIADICESNCKSANGQFDCSGARGGHIECPQLANDRNAAGRKLLAGLFLWRTRFWKYSPEVIWPTNGARKAYAQVRVSAIDALRGAARALSSRWEPSARFGKGGGRTLLRWFTATAIEQLVESKEFANDIKEPKAGRASVELVASLASLAAVLLGEGRWSPEAIRNLPVALGLYGHVILGVPDRMDLVRHLRQTLKGEAALHTLKQRYRDHFFHTIEVCLIGYALLLSKPCLAGHTGESFGSLLLTRCQEHRKKKTDSIPSLSPLPTDEKNFCAQWWVAALVHDTAYSIDALGGTLRLLEFFKDDGAVGKFIHSVGKSVAELGTGLTDQSSPLNVLANDTSLAKGDHGVIAAAHVHALLGDLGDAARVYLPAIRAAAFHNTKYPRIDAGEDPVAALLVLCDTVQDWGRSQLGFDKKPEVVLSRLIEAASTPPEEQFGNVETFSLSLTRESEKGASLKWLDPNCLTISLRFRDLVVKDCGAFFKWADVTHNLQRVDFEPWGCEMKLRYETPLAPAPMESGGSRSLFDFFCTFAMQREVQAVARWVDNARSGKDDAAIHYALSKESGKAFDAVTFDLRRLGKAFIDGRPMMDGTLGTFGSELKAWEGFQHACQACEPRRPSMA